MGSTHSRRLSFGEIRLCEDVRKESNAENRVFKNITKLSRDPDIDVTSHTATTIDGNDYVCGTICQAQSDSLRTDAPSERPGPSEKDQHRLKSFLISAASRRRAAVVVEAAAYDNGEMTPPCHTRV